MTIIDVQLLASLFIALLVFIVGIDRVSVRTGCIIVGVLIHYASLVAWLMIGAGVLLILYKIWTNKRVAWYYSLIVSVICWGKPL